MDKQCLEFSGLPKELRLLIWDATMEPKFLRIGIGKGNRTTADTWSPYGNPVALRVCVESRKRALERYTLPIGINRYHKDLPTGLAAAKRYIDPERDVLFFDPAFSPADGANHLKWGSINGDIQALKNTTLKRQDFGNRPQDHKLIAAIRRIAVPEHWWKWKCLNQVEANGLSAFAHMFFRQFNDIYIIAEWDDEAGQRMDGGGGGGGGVGEKESCAAALLDALMPMSIRPGLAELGYEVQEDRETQTVQVTKSGSGRSTAICDFFQAPLGGMDLALAPAVPGDYFDKRLLPVASFVRVSGPLRARRS